MAAKDPAYGNFVMRTLERRNEVAATDDLQECMSKLEAHLSTQLVKAITIMSSSNAIKRSRRGRAAGNN